MNKSEIVNFLETYKENQCLWNKSSKNYSDKPMRKQALQQLLTILKRTDSTANIDSVRKKIDMIRTSYNKERRKVVLSNYVYQPKLWFYEHLSFLHDTDPVLVGDDTCDKKNAVKSIKQSTQIKSSLRSSQRRKEVQKRIQKKIESPVKRKVKRLTPMYDDTFFITSDEFKAFGKMVEYEIKKLQHPERFIAQKLISDVIFYSKIGKITIDSFISTLPSPIIVTEYSEHLSSSRSDCNSPFITSPLPPSHTTSPSSRAQITTTFLPNAL